MFKSPFLLLFYTGQYQFQVLSLYALTIPKKGNKEAACYGCMSCGNVARAQGAFASNLLHVFFISAISLGIVPYAEHLLLPR
jgi:hypothetical protein